MRSRTYGEAMVELCRGDSALAHDVINGTLDDGDQAELLTVLRHFAQTYGGVQAVAAQAHLNPTQLYRMLSPKGNPALNSLTAILKAMGLRAANKTTARPPDGRVQCSESSCITHTLRFLRAARTRLITARDVLLAALRLVLQRYPLPVLLLISPDRSLGMPA